MRTPEIDNRNIPNLGILTTVKQVPTMPGSNKKILCNFSNYQVLDSCSFIKLLCICNNISFVPTFATNSGLNWLDASQILVVVCQKFSAISQGQRTTKWKRLDRVTRIPSCNDRRFFFSPAAVIAKSAFFL